MKPPRFISITCTRLAACLLPLLISTPLRATPPTARNLPYLMPAPEAVLQHATDLELSSTQRSQLESAVTAQQSALAQASEQVRQESTALAQLLAREKPDESSVAAQFEKVLNAENEIKRLRLKMSLRARALLTVEQQQKLETLQRTTPSQRSASPEQQELAAKMARVKELIERAKAEGRDLGNIREMWKRVDQATQKRNIAEACRILDEAAASLSVPPAKP
jgi:Spy/CpxP family protein refolding chaperone